MNIKTLHPNRIGHVKKNSWLLLGIVALLFGCSSQKEYITDYDYSFHGRFKKYKSFQFLRDSEEESTELQKLLMTSIAKKLHSQGYRYTDRKPDLLISYRLFTQDFKFVGYQQPSLEAYVYGNWRDKLIMEDESYVEDAPPGHPDTDYHANTYKMDEGTLLITFYDRKRDRTVWSGYASGVFANKDQNIERSLKVASGKILREFRLVANGYVQ